MNPMITSGDKISFPITMNKMIESIEFMDKYDIENTESLQLVTLLSEDRTF